MIEKTSTGKYRVRVDMGRGRSWEILCSASILIGLKAEH